MNEDRYLKVDEVAARFRRSSRTIRDWINTGCPTPNGLVRLEAVKLGKSWEIHPEKLAIFEIRVRPGRRPELDLE